MDIKDSYLHNTVGVIKSIDIEEDKLKYNLADKNNTEKVITLPLATQSSNGLLSKDDKIIIDSVSSQLTKPYYQYNSGNMSTGWIRIFSGTYQHYGTLSIKHDKGNVKLIIDFINNYSSQPYIKYINGISTNIISKIRFVKNGDFRYIDIYNLSAYNIVISFSSRDTRYQSSLPMILVNEDVSSYTVYEYDLYSGNWSNMSYISNKFIGNLQGNADTATEATHATNSDNATRANFAIEATHALNADEAIHSETADLADDLGGKPETHSETFIYQPTAADLSIKDGFAEIKSIKGNTLVWNQQVANYDTYKSRYKCTGNVVYNDGVFVLNSQSTKLQFTYIPSVAFAGRKIFVKFDIKTSESVRYSNIQIKDSKTYIGSSEDVGYITTSGDNYITYKSIKTTKTYTSANYGDLIQGYGMGIYIPEYTGTDVYVKNIQIFDLTKMFGEGNEPSTVEEFEMMFPEDYYEYNEDTLISHDSVGIKTVGFNQFDKSKVENNAYIDSISGNVKYANVNESISDYIKVIPNTDYYVYNAISSAHRNIAIYDSNKYLIGTSKFKPYYTIDGKYIARTLYTVPDNVHYIRFGVYNEYLDSCGFNISHTGYRNGEYQPYESHTTQWYNGKKISELTSSGEVIFPDGLRSAGNAYDEITKDSEGKDIAIKRIGSVDLGSLEWYKEIGDGIDVISGCFKTLSVTNSKYHSANVKANAITTYYTPVNSIEYANVNYNKDKVIDVNSTNIGRGKIMIRDTKYTDITSFKTSLQGQILYYELTEPEVYELDNPINTSYEAYDFGTEEVLYNDDSEVNIPMKASIEYGFNAVDMIRGNYFDIQKLKKKSITTDGGIIEGDLSVDNLIASKSVIAPTFIGNLEGRAKNADKADAITQSTTNETNTPILVHGINNTVTYNPNFTLNKFNEYLPLAGGAMSGNIDMRGNEIKNTNFELVESLPTENLYEGRQVTYDGKIYTYHNEKWINTADDLGDLKETLSSEFVFRPTADTHSVKDEFASVKSIKGNTIVWNQLNKTSSIDQSWNGLTLSWDNGVLTLNGTAKTDNIYYGISHGYKNIPPGHKYYYNTIISGEFTGSNTSYVTQSLEYTDKVSKTFFASDIKQNKNISTSINYTYFAIQCYEGDTFNNVKIKSIVHDLTQMFGEGNEPTIEEFEKFYSHLPTDYNEGSLLNLNADNIKSIGFNQWDEEWEVGFISSNGKNENKTNSVRSNYIKVLPNTKYYIATTNPAYNISESIRIRFYDNNKNYIGNPGIYTPNRLFTTLDGCCYMRWCTYPTVLPTNSYSKGDICINLSHNGEKDGEYQPYEEHIVNLPIKKYFPDGLKSAGTAYDEIVFDKNIGKYKAIQRIGSVDMGRLAWAYQSNITIFFTDGLYIPFTGEKGKNLVTVKYLTQLYGTGADGMIDNRCISGRNFDYEGINYDRLYIKDTSYTDVDSFKTSLQGQILYYELAEPIETIIEDYDLIAYKANDWGTEEIISEESTTPIKADIEYNFDGNEIIKYNYFRIDEIKKDYLHKDGIAKSAEKLARPVKLWGNNFDGSYDVNGLINYGLKINNTKDRISLLNIESVVANINYSHLYVTSTNESNIIRPLILQKGYGNVGIGLENPTEKLEVLGNVKATSFKGNLDWSDIINKPASFKPEDHTHSELTWKKDVRNVETSIDDYSTKFKFVGIKSPESLGLNKSDTGSWLSLFGWRGYIDKTGPHTYELASDSVGKLRVRSGDNTFGNWYTIAYTSDLSQYQPLISDLETIRSNANYGKTAYDWYQSITQDDTDTLINKWGEIVDFLDSVTEGTDIIDEFVTRKTNQTITGQKTFQSNSDTTGVSLILTNNAWTGNMSTALDFYSGYQYTVPNARIENKMVSNGASGGNLIFYTQQKSEQNPNPNALTERMRIDDLGKISITGPLFIKGTDAASANLAFSRNGYNYITFPSNGCLAIGKGTNGSETYVKFTSTDLSPERSNEINLGSSTNLFKNIYSDKIITTTDVVINNKSLLNILPADNTWSNRLNKQLKNVTTNADNSYVYIKTPLKCSGYDTNNGMNIIEINIYQHKPSNVATGVSKILLKWYGYDLSLYNYYRSSYAVLGEWIGQVYIGLDSSNNYNIIIHNPNGFNLNTIVSVPYFCLDLITLQIVLQDGIQE